MLHPSIKAEALGSFAGDTQGEAGTAESFSTALARQYTPTSTAMQARQNATRCTIYTDGACEPYNPGGWATWGWAAFDAAGQEIGRGRGCAAHGHGATNNLAEYTAALEAADWALAQGHRQVLLRTDSKLVAEQTAGRWACNAEHLRSLRDELRARLAAIGGTIEWIPREANTRADELSRLAYAEARTGAIR